MLAKSISALLALTAIGLAGCGDSVETAPESTLSALEVKSLTWIREEEKVARDVYAAIGQGNPPFANIQASEQTHMDAMLTLLTRYGVPDPVGENGAGVFLDPQLQSLHDTLVGKGKISLVSALEVGVAIEELDIRDLEDAKGDVTHNDITVSYDSLLRGSRNHLRSFYGKLKAAGGSYTPQYIDAASFNAIVNSPNETGK